MGNGVYTDKRKQRGQDKKSSGHKRAGCKVPYARTDVRKQSFTVRTVKNWKILPNSLRAEAWP